MDKKNERNLHAEIDVLKKEVEELKKIVQESKTVVNEKLDYDGYVKKANESDLEKFENFKLKWYWFIPVVGFFIFTIQEGINIASIDRGLVRSQYQKTTAIFFLLILIAIYPSFIINFFAIIDVKLIRPLTIKKIKANIAEKHDANETEKVEPVAEASKSE